MKKIIIALGLALAYLAGFAQPVPAALIRNQTVGGYNFNNNGSGNVANGPTNTSLFAGGTFEYPWEWSGPYFLSAVSATSSANVISPYTIDTNLTATYSGPVNVVLMASQLVAVSVGTSSLPNYAPGGTTYTAASEGIQVAANTGFNVSTWFGKLAPNAKVYVGTSMTAGTSNNVVYWVGDLNY